MGNYAARGALLETTSSFRRARVARLPGSPDWVYRGRLFSWARCIWDFHFARPVQFRYTPNTPTLSPHARFLRRTFFSSHTPSAQPAASVEPTGAPGSRGIFPTPRPLAPVESIYDPGPSGTLGASTWPAASGDGTQQDSSLIHPVWGSGPLERGSSSGCKSEGPRCLLERRGPPARSRTGRAGCFWLPGSGVYQPADQNARSRAFSFVPNRDEWSANGGPEAPTSVPIAIFVADPAVTLPDG